MEKWWLNVQKCGKFVEYGSCPLFKEFQLDVHELRDIPLRSDDPPPPEIVGQEEVDNFIYPGSFVALRPEKESDDDFWFVYVISTNLCNPEDVRDDYNIKTPEGTVYHTDIFLKTSTSTKSQEYIRWKTLKLLFFAKNQLSFHM